MEYVGILLSRNVLFQNSEYVLKNEKPEVSALGQERVESLILISATDCNPPTDYWGHSKLKEHIWVYCACLLCILVSK